MNKLISKAVKLFFALSIILSSVMPLQNAKASDPDAEVVSPVEIASELASTIPDMQSTSPLRVEAQPVGKADQPEYEIVQNADPYLMSLALGYEETKSQYGPDRNDPAEGIPDHAYSPFDNLDKREVCPPGGCDYVKGRVLIKLEPDQTFSLSSSNQILLQDQTLASTLAGLKITNLTPIFLNAEKPATGEMIETVDGDLIAKPDLTRWFQAESHSEKGLGEVIQVLQTTVGIAYAEPDFVRKPVGEMSTSLEGTTATLSASPAMLPGSTTDPLYDQQWHLAATHVPEAWAYLESQGLPPGGSRDIVVAVIDTGVDYTHPDLAANIWVNPPEFNGLPGVDDDGNGYVDDIHGADTVYPDGNPMDDHGHGTHVAGIIAAQANNGIGGVGVAYNVQVMPIKAAQYSGVLATSDIAEAIYYAVAKGADVINMSFGGYARSNVEEDALAVAFGQSVLVAAAGNDGKVNLPCPVGIDMYPASYNWVLGVMASQQAPNPRGSFLASFSNYDCAPNDTHEYELMAPGVGIWSTLPASQYAAWSGTSMAAPIVSGIAALARTKWSDNDFYSSRFIMGQIASNNSGGIANTISALTIAPQPELSYLEHWLFDSTDLNPINDNDGIVDSGETVDLAIVIRNHWGKAENVTVTLEAWAEGAVSPDPYVTMITDTVNYGAVGSFNWDDNGLIYDSEGLIIGVQNPFRFATDPNTPNDHLIPFRLTITASNGYDPDDPNSPYSFVTYFFLIVQKGIKLPRIISEDMTLTKDIFWLIPDSTLIESGVTVTVTEGTQIQFWSSDPDDPYHVDPNPYLQVEGTLLLQGTEDKPIEIVLPFYKASNHAIIRKSGPLGAINIYYVKYQNPDLTATTIDHSYFWQVGGLYLRPIIMATNTSYSIMDNLGLSDAYYIDGINHVNLFDTCIPRLDRDESVYNSVFLINLKYRGNNIWHPGIIKSYLEEDSFVNNAILNKLWDPNKYWMTVYTSEPRGTTTYINNNYWSTTSIPLIEEQITDYYDDFNKGIVEYEPILATAPSTAYPFVVGVVLTTDSNPDATVVGAEPVTFTVTFNRDMDQSIQPQVSFGPDVPMTDYTVHPIDGGWTDARTWVGTFNITPVTGDGYQLIRVAGAVAADDPWLVTGDDAGRFRFEVITSGTEAMNLQATGGEGYVDLMWTQTDFELLSGFHLYRSTSMDGTYTRINSSIIPPEIRDYRDTDVTPGQPYYYKFTVVKSDMSESDFSNTATATPLDTIPPVLTHTPVTSAAPGQPLTLVATATDNVTVISVTLFYRHVGDTPYASTAMVRTTGNEYFATIQGSLLSSPGIEYYIEATDGISITRNGRAENPNVVTVVDRPVVTIVTPNTGPAAGGTAVTITGSNFKSGATVTFGGMAASNVVFVSSNQITCITAAHIPETVDVRVTNPDAQFGVLLNGFTFFSTAAQISLPNTGGGTGNVVTVPINAANINGMLAAGLTVNFDPTVLSVQSASTGTLTAGWAFASNLIAPGQYRLSMSNSSAVSGAGTLANFEFLVIGAPGTSSLLSISNILLNDGAIAVELADGLFSVDNVYNVSGLVSFWNGAAPVSGALLTLTGDQVYSALSGLDGKYTVQGAAIDAYILTPSKGVGDNGIGAYDASFALQHDVGLITLTGNQALAADVNSNGYINSMDAAYILQKTAGLISLPFPGSGVVWKFNPASRNIPELTGNITAQDFTAILLGDISGNWVDPGEGLHDVGNEINAASAILTIPAVNVLPGGSIDVPINLDITDAALLGADLAFTYDPTHVSISNVRIGSLAAGWSLVSNLTQPGVVRIAMAGAMPITSDGELVLFTVTALGDPGSQSALTLTFGDLNEGAIPSTLVSGSVYIGIPVTADFSASPTSGVAPVLVSFTNLSTGDWTTASWNFGDGATSTDTNPSHTYTVAGTYTVSLTATGSGGTDAETKIGHITVYEPVSANFSATPTSGVAPLAVTFTNLSTGDWTTSSWDFGDGATSTLTNPSHTYTTAGTYTVSLTVSGLGGSDTEIKTSYITVYTSALADFSATSVSGVAPLSVSFSNLSTGDWSTASWDFGDGATSTEANPSHTYTNAGTYTVSLTVSGLGGSDTETKSEYITVYEPVLANFSATPTSGVAPLAVTLTNTSTGDWTTASWDFGDGATSTDTNPSHTYTTAGTYTVSLTVSGLGGSDTETKSAYITVYEPVSANFSATPTSGPAPLTVTFSNLSTGDWTTSSWDFGDGTTSAESNPTHTYTTAGTYTVSLTVTGLGGSDTETKVGYVQVSTLSISGIVVYWSGNRPIPGAVCTLSGDNTYSDTTDEVGQYIISGIFAGSYVLTPNSQSNINGITAYDAALVLRHAADIAPLTGYPALAADVNQSGEISSLDASYILQKSVGLIETFPGITDMWLFNPANYSYSNLLADQINQDFTGILLGDPTGNWSIEGGTMGPSLIEPSSILTIIATPPDTDGKVTATIYLNPNGTELYGLDLTLQYDPTHAELLSVTKGEIGDNWIFAANTSEVGVIRLGLADTQPLAEMQSIAVVEFHLLDLGRTSEFVPILGSVNEAEIPIDMTGVTLGVLTYKIFVPVIVR